jgi:4-amino-4-deoxy-L-arabinose transferase-like glycosyltransferase
MPAPPSLDARRAWAWRAAIALVLVYAAWLRLGLLFDRYGPFDHPRWLTVLEHVVDAPRPWLAPSWWRSPKVDPPYVGGDPINYIKFARELPSFYQATTREPVFLEVTRFFIRLAGDQDVGVSFASLTFSVLCVLTTYLLGTVTFSRGVGLAAATALAIEQEFASWAPDGWRDEASAAFVLLTAWALFRFEREPGWRRAIVMGVLAALACLTRITSFTFIIPGLIWASWPRSGTPWWSSARYTATAGLLALVLVAPYLINCKRVMGDALIAMNYHTRFYLAAEHEDTAAPPTAMQYVTGKFAGHPLAESDTAARGLIAYPFQTKWRGFSPWLRGLGPVLRWLSVVGLLVWMWQPAGRFLLLMLFTSLVPFMVTWRLQGGGEWRFTMQAYPFYLIAAFSAVGWVVTEVRALIADRSRAVAEWRANRLGEKAAATALVVLMALVAGYWSPYFIARESLLRGESTSIAAGDNDEVFFRNGWTGLVQAGAVTSRFALGERSTLVVPLPEQRDYHLVLRMDPVPLTAAVVQRIRVLINGREAGAFDLTWDAQRVGAYTIDLPARDAPRGRARFEFIADRVSPVGQAATMFPDLATAASVAFRLWYVRVTPQ